MKLKTITVQLGGFHDHWHRNGSEVTTLLMAAMQYYHYDFICLLDREFGEKAVKGKQDVERWLPGKKVFLGHEYMYDWGHMVTVENSAETVHLDNLNWREEMQNLHRGGGFIALAHIGYPYDKKNPSVFHAAELDEMIDGDYVDAIQLERLTDWTEVEARALRGDRLPLVGGWDSHYLKGIHDDRPNLYDAEYTPARHIDSAPGMRTIVFAEDNSLESIKTAIRQGKSVLEHVETGTLFGSPDLVQILQDEGYFERIRELSAVQNQMRLYNEPLMAYTDATLRFPGKGTVTYPADEKLTPRELGVDESGILHLDSVPMPAPLDFSYLPFRWKGELGERLWAVKVDNPIQYVVIPKILDGKRYLILQARNEMEGTVTVTAPMHYQGRYCAKKGEELLYLPIPEEAPDIFEIALTVQGTKGGVSHFSTKTGIAVAKPYGTPWAECPACFVNSQEQCGGFGNNRPYPGPEVFSGKAQFQWDENFLYLRAEIVDAIHIAPPSGAMMYRSDCICINFDPELARDHTHHGKGFLIGFPKEGPEVFSGGRKWESARLTMEKTPTGRVVLACLPWEAFGVHPESGLHMGMSFSFLNDEGAGLMDNLNWPVPPNENRMGQNRDKGMICLE